MPSIPCGPTIGTRVTLLGQLFRQYELTILSQIWTVAQVPRGNIELDQKRLLKWRLSQKSIPCPYWAAAHVMSVYVILKVKYCF